MTTATDWLSNPFNGLQVFSVVCEPIGADVSLAGIPFEAVWAVR